MRDVSGLNCDAQRCVAPEGGQSNLNWIHPKQMWYKCFVSSVAKQVMSNTVAAMHEVMQMFCWLLN